MLNTLEKIRRTQSKLLRMNSCFHSKSETTTFTGLSTFPLFEKKSKNQRYNHTNYHARNLLLFEGHRHLNHYTLYLRTQNFCYCIGNTNYIQLNFKILREKVTTSIRSGFEGISQIVDKLPLTSTWFSFYVGRLFRS